MKRTGIGTLVVLGLIIALIIGVASDRDATRLTAILQGTPSAKRTVAGDSTPGVTRVGKERAAQMWRDLPLTPGMQRQSCAGETCEVMFDPALWARMTSNQKRDFVAMMGIAFSYGHQARWTEVHDMKTNRRLARYSARFDAVDFD